MDVRQLAPSLLALAEVFDLAYQAATDGYTLPPALEVSATGGGSFIVDLLLAVRDGGDGVFEWAKAPEGAANGHSCDDPLRRVRRDPVDAGAEAKGAGGRRRRGCAWHDPDQLARWDVVRSASQRTGFGGEHGLQPVCRRGFQPLRRDGVEAIELERRRGAREAITVIRQDLGAFNVTEPDDDLISDNVRIVAVRLMNLAFKKGNKWRVSDGTSTFWASLHDLDFLQRVTSNEEVFARDDVLRVRLRDQQFRSSVGAFRMEHHIEKVLEHRRGTPPVTLPLELRDEE